MLTAFFLSLSAQTGDVGVLSPVHLDPTHWRVFCSSSNEKLSPLVVSFEEKKFSVKRMKRLSLGGKFVWSAEATGKPDLSYLITLEGEKSASDKARSILGGSIPDDRLLAKAADYPLPPAPPRWAQSTTIYRIEVDRFDRDGNRSLDSSSGTGWLGGNLLGIIKHLDYFTSLGVSTLQFGCLSEAKGPFETPSSDRIDPHYGDSDSLKTTLEELKRNQFYVLEENGDASRAKAFDSWPFKIAPPDWFENLKTWVDDPDAKASILADQLQFQLQSLADNDLRVRTFGGPLAPRPKNLEPDSNHERQLWLMLFSLPGIPMLRAGEEIGQRGGKFPENRDAMLWSENQQDQSLLSFIRQLIDLRRHRQSLQIGSFEILTAHDNDGILAFARRERLETTIAVFNNSNETRTWNFAANQFGQNLNDLLGGSSLGTNGGLLSLSLQPHGFALVGTP